MAQEGLDSYMRQARGYGPMPKAAQCLHIGVRTLCRNTGSEGPTIQSIHRGKAARQYPG